ncbi:hypothetical protein D9M70_533070 [compost metagenome]
MSPVPPRRPWRRPPANALNRSFRYSPAGSLPILCILRRGTAAASQHLPTSPSASHESSDRHVDPGPSAPAHFHSPRRRMPTRAIPAPHDARRPQDRGYRLASRAPLWLRPRDGRFGAAGQLFALHHRRQPTGRRREPLPGNHHHRLVPDREFCRRSPVPRRRRPAGRARDGGAHRPVLAALSRRVAAGAGALAREACPRIALGSPLHRQ